MTRWADKEACKIYIKWEDNQGGTAEKLLDAKDDSNYLLSPNLDFRLEPYEDGSPAPTPSITAAPFLLTQTNLKDVEVLYARAEAIVGPANHYYSDRFHVQRRAQMSRMRVARIFDPLYAQANKVTLTHVEQLSQFQLATHPDIAPHIAKLESELHKYNAVVAGIPPLSERQEGSHGKVIDTFNFQEWWCSVKKDVPSFFQVCRAVLTHSPNSCPPERLFSILNDSFDADQSHAYSDYIQLSLQLQYNSGKRKRAN